MSLLGRSQPRDFLSGSLLSFVFSAFPPFPAMSFSKAFFAALLSLGLLSGAAQAAHKATGLEGHWSGSMLSQAEEMADAELSLDNYGCYALSVKADRGIETGFYEVKDGRVLLKNSGGVVSRQLEVGKDGKLHLRDAEGKPLANAPKDCCSLYKD